MGTSLRPQERYIFISNLQSVAKGEAAEVFQVKDEISSESDRILSGSLATVLSEYLSKYRGAELSHSELRL